MNDQLRHAPIGVLEVTSDGTVDAANEAAAAVLDTELETLQEVPLEEAFPDSTAGTLHEAFGGDPPEAQSFEEYYPRLDRWLGVDIVPGVEQVSVYVRNRTRDHERRQRIDRLEQRLDRLQTIDSLVATVLRNVIETSAPVEVSRTVCERLGETDLYEFAWVGDRTLTDDRLRVVASAGEAPEMLERIGDSLTAASSLPEQEAASGRETQIVQNLAEDDSIPREVRLAAFGRGLQSCIAIPLAYRETVYGVLGVYASREDGFSTQERASLETLGAIAGFAINAIRQEGLLFADTVTELTVEIEDPSIPFLDAARSGNCQLTLAGAVPREDDTVVCYLHLDSGVGAVRDTLDGHERVVDVRRVGEEDSDDEHLLEVTVAGDLPVARFAAWGATILTAEYSDDVARLSAEVSSDTDLRQLVGAVDSDTAQTEVVAKQETEREPETVGAFRSELAEKLTDKQRRVLRTAYLSDYFASPRGSTSEEVADALDITGPTVLYHLRRGQRKLLETFFESASEPSPDTDTRV